MLTGRSMVSAGCAWDGHTRHHAAANDPTHCDRRPKRDVMRAFDEQLNVARNANRRRSARYTSQRSYTSSGAPVAGRWPGKRVTRPLPDGGEGAKADWDFDFRHAQRHARP